MNESKERSKARTFEVDQNRARFHEREGFYPAFGETQRRERGEEIEPEPKPELEGEGGIPNG